MKDSETVKKSKANVHTLNENQLIQQAQIQEQWELIILTRVEAVENHKPLRALSGDLAKLNTSFFYLSTETILLTYEKNFILSLLQLQGKNICAQSSLTQIQFDIQSMYSFIASLSEQIQYMSLL